MAPLFASLNISCGRHGICQCRSSNSGMGGTSLVPGEHDSDSVWSAALGTVVRSNGGIAGPACLQRSEAPREWSRSQLRRAGASPNHPFSACSCPRIVCPWLVDAAFANGMGSVSLRTNSQVTHSTARDRDPVACSANSRRTPRWDSHAFTGPCRAGGQVRLTATFRAPKRAVCDCFCLAWCASVRSERFCAFLYRFDIGGALRPSRMTGQERMGRSSTGGSEA
jgi:hypothetical protein